MKATVWVAIALIALAGCRKDIQNKEAVRQGVVDYLAKRPDMKAMDVAVNAVTFNSNVAKADVYISAKQGGGGMRIPYELERKGDRWVVKPHSSSAQPDNPHGGAMQAPSALPQGHPAIPENGK